MQHCFVAERAAAQHCAELLRSAADPAALLPRLAKPAERIARALAPALAGLLGGELPAIAPASPEERGEAELADQIGPLAASSLLASPAAGLTLLTSIAGGAMLRLVDRAFGGKGDAPAALPDKFPLSAEMMVKRLDEIVTRCIAEALSLDDLATIRRGSRIEELAPFAARTRLAQLQLEVTEAGVAPWHILLALPLTQLPRLPGIDGEAGPARHRSGSADPAAAPFAELPIPLAATLVDMRMPLSALAALAPGVVLPVAVERSVPVAAGGRILAHGTVGNADDRIAIKLTQLA